jgi:hypothetical protein
MAHEEKGITRRDFVKRAGIIGAGLAGVAGFGGFSRLADALADRAPAPGGRRPGVPGGQKGTTEWTCQILYCDMGAKGTDAQMCGFDFFTCRHNVECSIFDCHKGPVSSTYQCTTQHFDCTQQFSCGDDGGTFNCRGGQFECMPGSAWSGSCQQGGVFCMQPHVVGGGPDGAARG